MERIDVGAPKVQHPVQMPGQLNHPEELRVARPMLDGGVAMREPSDSTNNFDLVDPRAMAVRQLIVGTMLVVVGVVVTAATYTTARHDGDRYLLAFGPIVIGAIAMVRGFIGLFRP